MCIGAKACSELGDDPANWPKHAPLLPPTWFDDEVTKLTAAVRAAAAGDVENAKAQLALVRSDDLRRWVAHHGEQSGYRRANHFVRNLKNTGKAVVDRKRPASASQEKLVYERDSYRCRYCSSRVVPGVVLKLFSQVMEDDFGITGTRQEHHGAAVALRACADHVVPHARGGRTNEENLVTACWPCNFSKAGYAVEEIGIEDPRLRPPRISDDWDGLMSLVPQLQQKVIERGNTGNRRIVTRRTRPVRKKLTGTKGVGNVSIPVLYSWLKEWEENDKQPPTSWTRFRVSFFLNNLETIKLQTNDFKPSD